MKYKNLEAELARRGLGDNEIAEAIGKSPQTARNKRVGKTLVTITESFGIREKLFPSMTIEYLFDACCEDAKEEKQ